MKCETETYILYIKQYFKNIDIDKIQETKPEKNIVIDINPLSKNEYSV